MPSLSAFNHVAVWLEEYSWQSNSFEFTFKREQHENQKSNFRICLQEYPDPSNFKLTAVRTPSLNLTLHQSHQNHTLELYPVRIPALTPVIFHSNLKSGFSFNGNVVI